MNIGLFGVLARFFNILTHFAAGLAMAFHRGLGLRDAAAHGVQLFLQFGIILLERLGLADLAFQGIRRRLGAGQFGHGGDFIFQIHAGDLRFTIYD